MTVPHRIWNEDRPDRIPCPACAGRGLVREYYLFTTREFAWICDRCDSEWPTEQAVHSQEPLPFTEFMAQRDLAPDRGLLTGPRRRWYACPDCHGNGAVREWRNIRTGEPVWWCGECESRWRYREEIGVPRQNDGGLHLIPWEDLELP